MKDKHLSLKEIQAYIELTLDEEDNDRVTAHLGNCDICLQQVEAAWEKVPLPNIKEREVQKRLWQNINRSNLAGSLLGLGVQGFLKTIAGLLAPLLKTSPNNRKVK